LEGAGGSDTYVYNPGDGDDVIFDSELDSWATDTLVFGAGITPNDLILSRTGDWYDIRISFVGQTGSIVLDNQNDWGSGIEVVTFADGTTWNQAQLTARYVADQQTTGNDLVWGTAEANTISAGAGNDRLEGSGGADTYVYNIGDGNDVIADNEWDSWSVDTLLFG